MSEKNSYGKINLDYNNPSKTDIDLLKEELMVVRIDILHALARARVVYERVLQEGRDLDSKEESEGVTNDRRLNEEEMEATVNSIKALNKRLIALDKTFELVNNNGVPELFNIEE